MKAQRLIKAIEKAGFKVVAEGDRHFTASGPKYVCSFYVQDESAICVNLRRFNDVSDMMTDYHAGFFAKTIKRVVETLSTPKAA